MAQETITSVGYWPNRWVSGKEVAPYAKRLEDSGVVDEILIWDWMNNWFPRSLWEPSVHPAAALIPDADSMIEPYLACAYAQAQTDRLWVSTSSDACRRDPPEIMQLGLTLSNATQGGARLLLGAGEVRHIDPFGRKRANGIKRLEDFLRVSRMWLESDGPIDFEGKYWTMKDAWLGKGGMKKPPELIPLGGGPKLIDLAARYGDGMVTGSPFVFSRPDEYGAFVKQVLEAVRGYGRETKNFRMGLYHVIFLYDDRKEFTDCFDNPLIKWYVATGGRLNQRDWEKEGIKPIMPEDWHYAFNMLTASMPKEEALAVANQVTPEMMEKGIIAGTPAEVAKLLNEYTVQGCNYHLFADIGAGMSPNSDPERVFQRSVELCRLLKQG